jgi:hypothetical protein
VTAGFTKVFAPQSKSLGFEPAALHVPHPIQNRTPDELRKIADDAIEPALRLPTAAA